MNFEETRSHLIGIIVKIMINSFHIAVAFCWTSFMIWDHDFLYPLS